MWRNSSNKICLVGTQVNGDFPTSPSNPTSSGATVDNDPTDWRWLCWYGKVSESFCRLRIQLERLRRVCQRRTQVKQWRMREVLKCLAPDKQSGNSLRRFILKTERSLRRAPLNFVLPSYVMRWAERSSFLEPYSPRKTLVEGRW